MQGDEQFRHRCEVRMLLAMRAKDGRDAVREWLDDLAKRRGLEQADSVRKDCAAQWVSGNRGEFGDWR